MKFNLDFHKIKFWLINFASVILLSSIEIRTQPSTLPVPGAKNLNTPEDYTGWYVAFFLLFLILAGLILWRTQAKKELKNSSKKAPKKALKKVEGSFDAEKELEWYRKNQKLMGGKTNGGFVRTNGDGLPENKATSNGNGINNGNDTPELSKKATSELPVFSIQKIQPPKPFAQLPISNDESLMCAIEQTHEEFEDDEEIRELSVRILAAFKTRNSVEALSEVALYDLSSNLRSKAVTVLSEFDHESVFETILVACADPSREVKAAAARALFRLSFDRANAWTRITDTEEEGRIRQIARAAIEADLVERSLDRLVHEDLKIAQEAAAFTTMMIKSGETKEVFNALVNHKKMSVRKAILHIIKITKDQKALEGLYSLLEQNNLPLGLQEEVDKTIEEIGFVTV